MTYVLWEQINVTRMVFTYSKAKLFEILSC